MTFWLLHSKTMSKTMSRICSGKGHGSKWDWNGRIVHHCRWVEQSAAAVPRAGAACCRAAPSPLFQTVMGVFVPSSCPRFLWARALHPVLELSTVFFACSKDGQDAVVLPPDNILARFNWCSARLSSTSYEKESAVIKGLFDSLVHLWEWRGTHWQDERRLQKRMQAIAESNQTATFLGAL